MGPLNTTTTTTMSLLLFILLPVFRSSVGETVMESETSGSFLRRCLNEPSNCSTYRCFAESRDKDIRSLGSLTCFHDEDDCLSSITGLTCRPFSNGGYCDCPRGYAYNASECRCRQAEPCKTDSSPIRFCHNEMKCMDKRCSCGKNRNMKTDLLFEPHGRLCVIPRTSSEDEFRRFFPLNSTSSYESLTGASVALIVICVSFLVAVTVVLFVRRCRDGTFTCQRGDYKCDEDSSVDSSVIAQSTHVAAWDLTSLDYLTEEEAMKYIKKERQSPDSLPECEQSHINQGYVSDHHH